MTSDNSCPWSLAIQCFVNSRLITLAPVVYEFRPHQTHSIGTTDLSRPRRPLFERHSISLTPHRIQTNDIPRILSINSEHLLQVLGSHLLLPQLRQRQRCPDRIPALPPIQRQHRNYQLRRRVGRALLASERSKSLMKILQVFLCSSSVKELGPRVMWMRETKALSMRSRQLVVSCLVC